jgi:RNA polymerase sigma factor (sigma-70 family)
MMVEEIETLVLRAQAGDSEAFAQIVERFQDMAYGYAYAFLNDFPQAEDAAQEAFIQAYRSFADLREPRAFPAWFKRILFKYCDRVTRGNQPNLSSLEAEGELVSSLPGPAEAAEQNELTQSIDAAIQGLPLDQRVATTLFYIDGYSQQEIAEFLEVPAKTVKSRLHSSRLRLKERMIAMVEDEFKHNPLSENFTRATVDLAVNRARELNQTKRYQEAETLLRNILSQAPEHPEALKELNRAMFRGQVFGYGRWDLLPELVLHGQTILKANEDIETRCELAKTLLAIPAMPQAVDFIQQWITHSGPDLERLGMLAWAYGCLGDYTTAEKLWQELMPLAEKDRPNEVLARLSLITMSLVDCFVAGGDLPRAQRVAQEGWNLCKKLESLFDLRSKNYPQGEGDWITTFFQAGLDYKGVTRSLLASMADQPGLEACGVELCMRAYLDDPQIVMADWIAWLRECSAAGEWQWISRFHQPITRPFRLQGLSDIQIGLAQATWEFLRDSATEEAVRLQDEWNMERFNFFTYADHKDWESMERLAWRGIREWKLDENATGVIVACAALGKPTPPELVQAAETYGVERVDSYGLFGWYMLAREAAAAGEEAKAFEALRRSVGYWSNPPLLLLGIWENDLRWGNLRDHPEFKRIFLEKRQRIGPIYGILHYFPGW